MSETTLQRIARGDATAVAGCLAQYAPLVWGLAERYLRPYGEDVEGAVQDVFVEVWRSAGRYDPARGSEAAFVATIAHSRLIDRQRRATARSTPRVASPETFEHRVELKTTPDTGEDARLAIAAYNELEDDEKRVVYLSVHRGLTHEQIAQLTQAPLGTVKTRIRRALRKIRSAVDPSSLVDRVIGVHAGERLQTGAEADGQLGGAP
ncbi:MAG: sigma-70 family RNA polymerase sigma factor [Planctomycetota bacterium]|nr:sigma-70 family RNA polymerase sigma factor [Planctomycetota bacterium]